MKKACRPRSLGKYIQFSFILTSVIPMLLACSFCMLLMVNIYEHNNNQSLELNLGNAEKDINQWLDTYSELLTVCATDPDIVSQVHSERTLNNDGRNMINALTTGYRNNFQLHILSRDGTFRYSTGSIPNIYKMPVYQDTGIFREIFRNDAPFAARATKYTTYNGRSISLTLGVPVCNAQGEVVGCVLADIYQDALGNLLEPYAGQLVNDVLFVDGSRIVAYSHTGNHAAGLRLQDSRLTEVLSGGNPKLSSQERARILSFPGGLALMFVVSTELKRMMYTLVMVGLGAMLLIAVATAVFSGTTLSRRISRQIHRLLQAMRDGPYTGFTSRYVHEDGDFTEVVQLGDYYNELSDQTRAHIASIEDKQRMLAIAELNVLKMQMRPHFIYNILNDIKSMAKLSRTQEITELVVCFSAILRSSLATDEEFCTLAEEIDLVEKYIHMQNLRVLHPTTLKLSVDPSLMNVEIPRLVLQPLVENSLSHGLARAQNPIIRISAKADWNLIRIDVADNGEGIREMDTPKRMDGIKFHTGIGLPNIARRLELYYGSEGTLQIRSKRGCYTVVTLTLKERHM